MSMVYPAEWIDDLDPTCLQQNAVDIRVNKVVEINLSTPFTLSEDTRLHREFAEAIPVVERPRDSDVGGEYWVLGSAKQHTAYQLECNYVRMPPGKSGTVIMRSSLNRNGVFITSGLYDSGFEGIINCTLHIPRGVFKLYRNTRVAQFIMFEAETHSLYNGVYKNNNSHVG